MNRTKLRLGIAGVVLLSIVACIGVYQGRRPLSWLFPIDHTGKVMRIAKFSKGGWSARNEDTHQLVQFAIFFEDGFDCEGYDSSFAAIREGDTIAIRGYHDVHGTPVLDPEWWECDEAQLVRLFPAGEVPPAPAAPAPSEP